MRPTYLPPVKPVCRSRSKKLEPDMEEWTGSGKSTARLYIVTLLV